MRMFSIGQTWLTTGGITPRLINLRIDRVKHLLLRVAPLTQVALATGFSDALHLSKTFKHIEGISPRDFLNKTAGPDVRMPVLSQSRMTRRLGTHERNKQ